MMETMELADFEKMNQIRSRVDELVEEPQTAAALKPWYRQFCKRPCFHDAYLQSFNRPNVTLVDTQGRGVDCVTDNGVMVDGVEYEVDCLIFATGFEVGTEYTRRAGYEIVGRDGVTLTERWADGVVTLHGMHTHGFPNLFTISHTQGGFTVNYPHMLNEVSKHLAYIVQQANERDARVVEATPEAEAAWGQTIIGLARFRLDFLKECTPGYYNNEGKPDQIATQNSPYGLGSVPFFNVLADWRQAGDLAGLELK